MRNMQPHNKKLIVCTQLAVPMQTYHGESEGEAVTSQTIEIIHTAFQKGTSLKDSDRNSDNFHTHNEF